MTGKFKKRSVIQIGPVIKRKEMKKNPAKDIIP
jgi:hypothetical protein